MWSNNIFLLALPWFQSKLLSDVLCEIESKNRVDISDEPVDALALRLLTSLQIFKFKPETEDP